MTVRDVMCGVRPTGTAHCTVYMRPSITQTCTAQFTVPAKGSKPDPDRYYMHQTPDSRKKSSRVEEWQSMLWLLAPNTFFEGDSFHLVGRPGGP